MRPLYILLLLLLPILAFSQPGPESGTLRFRVFKPNGKVVTSEDRRFEIKPVWDSTAYYDSWFARDFKWEEGNYLSFESYPTPVAGGIPKNFRIAIRQGKRKMEIKGVDVFRVGVTSIDSDPFYGMEFRGACILF